MIATLSFFIENVYVTAISFSRRNDTPTFCQLTEFIPQTSSSLRLLVLCLVRQNLFVIHYCWFIFLSTNDKCHTSVFNALITYGILPLWLWYFYRWLFLPLTFLTMTILPMTFLPLAFLPTFCTCH